MKIGQSWTTVLKEQAEKATSKVNGAATNGDVGSEESREEGQSNGVAVVDTAQRKEVLTQSLFDVLLLQSSFELQISTDDELGKLGGKLEEEADLDSASRKRLQTAAKEYWKRTSLLFGLLA